MPASDSNITLPVDGSGKKLRTRTGMTRATDPTSHQEIHTIGGSDGDLANVEPFGAVMVNMGPTTTFYEAWSLSPIETSTKWTVTGTAPTIAGGNMTMPSTPSTFHAIRSKSVIIPNAGFTINRNGIALEGATPATGCGRFWGLGTPANTPAVDRLAQDGIGFEMDQATGALYAVTYSGGVRTIVATLTRPTDGLTHGYGVYFRVTVAYWQIDGITVASQTFPSVSVVELPSLIVRQNAAAFAGNTPVFTNIASLTGDTARQSGTAAQVSSPTNVAGSTTSAVLLAANLNRKMATVYNDSTAILYLLLGTGTASSTSFTIAMAAGSYYEVPTAWTGALTGVWAAAAGAARITEMV